jgi:glucose-6-phosphate 1-dehydrogenase
VVLIDPLIQAENARRPLEVYTPGTWGPESGQQLMTRDGREWRWGCTQP